MWLMTTKGRPKAAKAAIDACWDTGMRQPAVMFVDGDPAGYDFTLPDNWELVEGRKVSKIGNLGGSKVYILERFPDERVYGWMADDNYPVTPGWSGIVEEKAAPWRLVHCRDDYVSDPNVIKGGVAQLQATRNLGGGICWGGELIRCVGWWCPPGIVQAGIDWTWTSLVGGTAIGLYLPDVLVRHNNYRTGRRPEDATDVWGAWMKPDLERTERFIHSREFRIIKERIMREYDNYVSGRP